MPWSEELQSLTRRTLRDGTLTLDGSLALKHIDGRFGLISLADQTTGRLCVVDRRTSAEITFADAEALVADGWALD